MLIPRIGIGLVLLALATGVGAADWRKVGESPKIGDLLADMDSIERAGDTLSVWLKWPTYKSEFEPRAASASIRTNFYCGAGDFEMFDMIIKDERDNVLHRIKDEHGRNKAVAGTVFGSASDAVCKVTPNQ